MINITKLTTHVENFIKLTILYRENLWKQFFSIELYFQRQQKNTRKIQRVERGKRVLKTQSAKKRDKTQKIGCD